MCKTGATYSVYEGGWFEDEKGSILDSVGRAMVGMSEMSRVKI